MKTKSINLNNNKGIALIALIAIIIMVLATAFTAIYFMFYGQNDAEIQEFVQGDTTENTSENVKKIRKLGMDARIVSSITEEDVPIPGGFSYVQGEKNTGIIVKSNKTEQEYLFIPYDENINVEIEDYYKKVDYIPMDILTLNGIKKYNGFFIELNCNIKMEDLKTINKSNYEFQYKQMQHTVDGDSINAHLLYREEIAQINSYLQKNNIKLGEKTIGIQALVIEPFSKVNPAELTLIEETINTSSLDSVSSITPKITKTVQLKNVKLNKLSTNTNKNDKNYVYMYETSSRFYAKNGNVEIPIPSGFNYCEIDGVILIQDENFPKLVYIWVPLPIDKKEIKENNLKEKVTKIFWEDLFEEYAKDNNFQYEEKGNYLNQLQSGEFWEDLDEEFIQSMQDYGGFYISQAELSYNKYDEFMNVARSMVNNTVTQTVDKGDYFRTIQYKKEEKTSSKIFKRLKKIAKEANSSDSVVSHMMYGLEFDATLTWIVNTNKDYTDKEGNNIYKVMCSDSSNVGKYYEENSDRSGTLSYTAFESFNEIWGLAGNLFELTCEERKDGKYSIRSGSYAITGEQGPIAQRQTAKELVGSRDGIGANEIGDTIGLRTTLYIKPGLQEREHIEEDSDVGNTFEYNPSNDLQVKDGDITYQQYSTALERYVNDWNGINVYKSSDVKSVVLKKLNMAETVIVDAKAIEETTASDGSKIVWARIVLNEPNNKYGYIDALKLTGSLTTLGDDTAFVINNQGAVRYYKKDTGKYATTNDNSLIENFESSGQLEVIGKSVNQQWSVYKEGEEYRFVHANDLSIVSNESSNDKQDNDETIDDNFTVTNDVVYVTAKSGLNARTNCDENSEIYKTIPYRWGVDRLATGKNGWDKVILDGNVYYMSSEDLSKEQPAASETTNPVTKTAEPVIKFEPDLTEWPASDGFYHYKVLVGIPENWGIPFIQLNSLYNPTGKKSFLELVILENSNIDQNGLIWYISGFYQKSLDYTTTIKVWGNKEGQHIEKTIDNRDFKNKDPKIMVIRPYSIGAKTRSNY